MVCILWAQHRGRLLICAIWRGGSALIWPHLLIFFSMYNFLILLCYMQLLHLCLACAVCPWPLLKKYFMFTLTLFCLASCYVLLLWSLFCPQRTVVSTKTFEVVIMSSLVLLSSNVDRLKAFLIYSWLIQKSSSKNFGKNSKHYGGVLKGEGEVGRLVTQYRNQ